MLIIINKNGDVSHNHYVIPQHTNEFGYYENHKRKANNNEDVEKKEPLCNYGEKFTCMTIMETIMENHYRVSSKK
jgi:hypothetical protein